jgi:hypothetical protein
LTRNVPACQSILSTSVVLPWSTWATMAMFRNAYGRGVLLMRAHDVASLDPSRKRSSSPKRPEKPSFQPFKSAVQAEPRTRLREGVGNAECDDVA